MSSELALSLHSRDSLCYEAVALPQARLSASANALRQPPTLHHYAAAGPWQGEAATQHPASELQRRIAALEAQLAARQQHGTRPEVLSQQEAARRGHGGNATANSATEEGNPQLATELAESHRQLTVVQVRVRA